MSYDVSIGPESLNYTFNVATLFYDHMPEGIRGLDGLTGAQARDAVADALREIERTRLSLWESSAVGEPRFCAKYDAPNGWGSTVGGISFLARILAACAQNPRKRVRVYA